MSKNIGNAVVVTHLNKILELAGVVRYTLTS